eukprot:g28565.t1
MWSKLIDIATRRHRTAWHVTQTSGDSGPTQKKHERATSHASTGLSCRLNRRLLDSVANYLDIYRYKLFYFKVLLNFYIL